MRAALAALFVLFATASALGQEASMGVQVGGVDGPACPSRGVAGGATEVLVGPGKAFEVIDRLKPGEVVFLCNKARDFYGIVYGQADCGVSAPLAERQGYIGACKTGWVPMRLLTPAAQ